ncbi:MAG: MFS transporter [Phycisphaerales bacterium]|nr:MFS transporter [Phycisphaerales bacterium]
MSSAGLLDSPPAIPALGRIRARTWTTVAIHGVVDFFSYILIPLMPVMSQRLHLTPGQVAATLALGSVASGLIQPFVAWASDRLDTRWLGTAGLLAAVVPYSLLGYATTFPQLLVIQVIGAAGVGAFHPVAAAAIGTLSSGRRSLGVAVFFMGGMIGGITGSLLSPVYADRYGMPALIYLLVPGMASVLALGWAVHSVGHTARGARESHLALSAAERSSRWAAIGLLYLANVLRFTVSTALVWLIITWAERRTLAGASAVEMTKELSERAARLNGPTQAAIQVGMGIAGVGAGFLLARGTEKRALVVVPTLGALAVAAFPFLVGANQPGAAAWVGIAGGFVAMLLAGIGFGGVIPVSIALAQRLLPHRTGLASGLMMGGAWCVAAVGAPMAERLDRIAGLGGAYLIIAGLLLASGVLALALPGGLIRTLAH